MRGWRLSPRHFVERFGQIILIALGESVVAIGVGAAGLELDPGLIGTVLLGVTVVACLWWSYFDWVVYVAQSRLVEATGARRAALARDVYSYLHLPMVGGIVLFAFGLETALHDTSERRWRSFPRSGSSAASRCTSSPTSRSDSASAADSDAGDRSLLLCCSRCYPLRHTCRPRLRSAWSPQSASRSSPTRCCATVKTEHSSERDAVR